MSLKSVKGWHSASAAWRGTNGYGRASTSAHLAWSPESAGDALATPRAQSASGRSWRCSTNRWKQSRAEVLNRWSAILERFDFGGRSDRSVEPDGRIVEGTWPAPTCFEVDPPNCRADPSKASLQPTAAPPWAVLNRLRKDGPTETCAVTPSRPAGRDGCWQGDGEGSHPERDFCM